MYRIFYLYAGWKERFMPDTKDTIKELLLLDMQDALNPEAIKKFERKGWDIL